MIIMERKDLKICRVAEEILLTHSQGIVESSSMTYKLYYTWLLMQRRMIGIDCILVLWTATH